MGLLQSTCICLHENDDYYEKQAIVKASNEIVYSFPPFEEANDEEEEDVKDEEYVELDDKSFTTAETITPSADLLSDLLQPTLKEPLLSYHQVSNSNSNNDNNNNNDDYDDDNSSISSISSSISSMSVSSNNSFLSTEAIQLSRRNSFPNSLSLLQEHQLLQEAFKNPNILEKMEVIIRNAYGIVNGAEKISRKIINLTIHQNNGMLTNVELKNKAGRNNIIWLRKL